LLLVHGAFEPNDMVQYFGEQLEEIGLDVNSPYPRNAR